MLKGINMNVKNEISDRIKSLLIDYRNLNFNGWLYNNDKKRIEYSFNENKGYIQSSIRSYIYKQKGVWSSSLYINDERYEFVRDDKRYKVFYCNSLKCIKKLLVIIELLEIYKLEENDLKSNECRKELSDFLKKLNYKIVKN